MYPSHTMTLYRGIVPYSGSGTYTNVYTSPSAGTITVIKNIVVSHDHNAAREISIKLNGVAFLIDKQIQPKDFVNLLIDQNVDTIEMFCTLDPVDGDMHVHISGTEEH
jgi:hypothetical protein